MRGTKRRVAGVRLILATAVLLVAASCVQGPITTGTPAPLGSSFDLGQIGYQRSELYLTGFAQSYALAAPIPTDGKLQVAPVPRVESGVYRTRLVVFRPVDPSKFNGTVVVEWLNVSAGGDIAFDWTMAHNELVRSGAAYVGVSAQAVGVNALKNSGNPRYASLTHPGDSYSYDIFTHAGQRVRDNAATILGGLTPARIIAAGESQSASRMVTYIDAVQPLEHVYDGFMVHSRGSSGASLSQDPLPSVPFPAPAPIRNDLDVPVMEVQAEGDVISSNLLTRQPDTAKFRAWEMAGTSHADTYSITVGGNDTGNGDGAVKMLGFMRAPLNAGCGSPVNAGPHHWLLQAAWHHLDNWARTGVAPPVGPLLHVASTSPVVLARDANGNALGGVRSPQVDAPVATLLGTNTGAGFCRLFGTTIPLTTAQLHALYPTHSDFVNKWVGALFQNVAAGFILPADASELANAGIASTVPD
jgi:hypothetical protein